MPYVIDKKPYTCAGLTDIELINEYIIPEGINFTPDPDDHVYNW